MAAEQMLGGPQGASPLAYPEGWFQVSHAEDLPAGEVMPLHYFGRELVLFRTDSGVPQVLDGHCVHLGAHLGHGGRVEDDRLLCPFHSWAYGTDGVCLNIPYAERIPRGARQRAWPTLQPGCNRHSGLRAQLKTPVV